MIGQLPVHGRAATGAKVKRDGLAAVPRTGVLSGASCNPHLVACKACLNAESTARSPLAGETVTDRNACGVAHDFERELSAATARLGRHGQNSDVITHREYRSLPSIMASK